MKFFLDENFPKKAAYLLSDRGYAVLDVRGTDQEGLKDEIIFELARKAGAIFLTTDKDFSHSIHLKLKPHSGIVVIALKRPDAASILERLKWFLNNCIDQTISNKCFLILDLKCIVYE
jgi:predicted nuclease of predicted toxin-antitoxin system